MANILDKNGIKIEEGARVLWHDPAIDEYDDYEEAINRIFSVDSVSEDVVEISEVDGDTCGEVLPSELEVIDTIQVEWDCDDPEIGLPAEVRVPNDVEEDDITDWLSDTYGWLVNEWFWLTK